MSVVGAGRALGIVSWILTQTKKSLFFTCTKWSPDWLWFIYIITCVGEDVASWVVAYDIHDTALLEANMAGSSALGHSNSTSDFCIGQDRLGHFVLTKTQNFRNVGVVSCNKKMFISVCTHVHQKTWSSPYGDPHKHNVEWGKPDIEEDLVYGAAWTLKWPFKIPEPGTHTPAPGYVLRHSSRGFCKGILYIYGPQSVTLKIAEMI